MESYRKTCETLSVLFFREIVFSLKRNPSFVINERKIHNDLR